MGMFGRKTDATNLSVEPVALGDSEINGDHQATRSRPGGVRSTSFLGRLHEQLSSR